ncbi:hypothetical protein BT63DRAFT_425648 [Microthyrium microscopicum]|uniref:Mitochondrial K+-H+ exchange-related-domain-containing protein n=1 Tax=Microthyrium microscopicum TaxID=703497 RepID=A0A6A6UA55_9PEZI|nr:hypothetical protein BT63DRAFT_425648 [Microthyrium microscopicum]
MRLFLLPISARRTLIYCDKQFKPAALKALQNGPGDNTKTQTPPDTSASAKISNLVDRATNKAATTWTTWEKADGGWRKTLTTYGNAALRRIPYQEWGLKSIPPHSQKREEELLVKYGQNPVPVFFPPTFLARAEVPEILRKLATERQDLHRTRMIQCGIGAPLTLPFALLPVIPNIPGFYLLFRAWSHYRALFGSRHLEFLVKNNLFTAKASPKLDDIYTKEFPDADGSAINAELDAKKRLESGEADVLLLNINSGRTIATAYGVEEMAVEIERAVEQVEKIISKDPNDSGTAGNDEKKADDEQKKGVYWWDQMSHRNSQKKV